MPKPKRRRKRRPQRRQHVRREFNRANALIEKLHDGDPITPADLAYHAFGFQIRNRP